jgi:hypothetical protein
MILYPRYLPVAGFTIAPNLIFIRAEYRDSEQLLAHEQTHATQMREDGLLTFWFRYLFLPKWRQAYEVQAYRTQIAHGGSLDGCASHLAGMYYLGLTFDQAKALLK